MISNKEMEAINKGWKTINIIWVAMLVSLFIYLFVGLYIKDNIQISTEESLFRALRSVLYIVSIITLIVTRYIRKSVLKSKVVTQRQGENIQSPALARYSTAMIVSLSMSESVGIYGLILVLVGKNTMDLYLLIFIAVAAMLYYRPNKEEVISLANELKET